MILGTQYEYESQQRLTLDELVLFAKFVKEKRFIASIPGAHLDSFERASKT